MLRHVLWHDWALSEELYVHRSKRWFWLGNENSHPQTEKYSSCFLKGFKQTCRKMKLKKNWMFWFEHFFRKCHRKVDKLDPNYEILTPSWIENRFLMLSLRDTNYPLFRHLKCHMNERIFPISACKFHSNSRNWLSLNWNSYLQLKARFRVQWMRQLFWITVVRRKMQRTRSLHD